MEKKVEMGNRKNVMITVTEKCNLKCVYCFEKNKNHKSMDINTAISIINNEMNEENEYEEILFDFMGGEPFVEFQLIRQICEYTWSKKWEKKYLFFASTNGTLIHDEIQYWLKQHKDKFVCGISLDGLPRIHNNNRTNSYDLIDINFFLSTWPEQGAKMTIYPSGLPFLFDSIVYLHDLGFRITSNLAYGPDWSSEDDKKYYASALNKLIDYYVQNYMIEPTTIVNMDINTTAYPKEKIRKWCGMGDQMIAYDIYGKKFPCHFFQDMSSSMFNYDELIQINYNEIQETLNEKCSNCILRNCCPTCYGYNHSISGEFGKKDERMCEYKRMSALATSTLRYRRIKKKYNNNFTNLDDYEKETMVSVRNIQQAAISNDWTLKI